MTIIMMTRYCNAFPIFTNVSKHVPFSLLLISKWSAFQTYFKH